MVLIVIGWALVVLGALAVYLSRLFLTKIDAAFDLEKNPDYSYKKLAVYKFGGFLVTLVGIVILLVKNWN